MGDLTQLSWICALNLEKISAASIKDPLRNSEAPKVTVDQSSRGFFSSSVERDAYLFLSSRNLSNLDYASSATG